jgi:hypothetical protein
VYYAWAIPSRPKCSYHWGDPHVQSFPCWWYTVYVRLLQVPIWMALVR